MSTYLVTGHRGFIGKRLKDLLTSKGHIVIGFEIDDAMSSECEPHLISIFDKGIDGVFHVGACSDTLEKDVNYMLHLNFEFTRKLCDLCNKYGKRIVYSSSAANYGTNGKLPANLYAWSKYAGEKYVNTYENSISLRYFNVFGPGEDRKGRMASVAYQAFKKYHIEKSIEYMELFPGNPRRDFIHVDDIVNANIHAMEIGSTGTFDIGTTTPIGFEVFMDILNIPYTFTDHSAIPEGYQFFTCADTEKILPGWSPKFGINERIKHYKKNLQEEAQKLKPLL